MATVTFVDISKTVVQDVSTIGKKYTKIFLTPISVKINDIKSSVKKITTSGYPILKTIYNDPTYKVEQILPFRVSFTSLTVEGYTAKRPAPIGIAIVGVNNYIL